MEKKKRVLLEISQAFEEGHRKPLFKDAAAGKTETKLNQIGR